MGRLNFTTEKSQKRLAVMLNRLALGPANTLELIEAAGCHRTTASEYMKCLLDDGAVIRTADAVASFGQSIPAMWALAPDTAIPKMPDGCTVRTDAFAQGDERKVTVLKEWPPIDLSKPQSIFAALGL